MPSRQPYHGMVELVATKKITITMPEETLERVSALARAADLPLSTYVTRLAEHRIRIEDGLAAMKEWEQEYGPPSADAERWLEEQLSRLGTEFSTPDRAAG